MDGYEMTQIAFISMKDDFEVICLILSHGLHKSIRIWL